MHPDTCPIPSPTPLIIDVKVCGHRVRQVLYAPIEQQAPSLSAVDPSEYTAHIREVLPRSSRIGAGDEAIGALSNCCTAIVASWERQFQFHVERLREDGVTEKGLRAPQIGALHALLAHWTVGCEPATVVMPTGTGKTETMLAITVHERVRRLLVIVPTAALRDQTTYKYLSLGLLKRLGVVGQVALPPIVGTIDHRIETPDEVEALFQCCNVVISTMAMISGCSAAAKQAMAVLCSHLFIDEAHHIPAPSWDTFRRLFAERAVVQFTATPFRRDGKHVDGKIIYSYPLRKAQAEQYFKPITFIPIQEYHPKRTDEKIARAAVGQLRADLARGLNHLIMARADTVERAGQIHAIYQLIADDYHPVLLHSRQGTAARREGLQRLRGGASRIVVCVDMLGEGFDLPQLKIAALHDIHKSLAITLQFTGRFTRHTEGVGNATVIANIADADVDETLRALYAEDPDWNTLLHRLSEGATGRELRRSQFFEGFIDVPEQLALQNVLPKMSTVVYRTKCQRWRPDAISEFVKEEQLFAGPTTHPREQVTLFITCEREEVPWGEVKDLRNTTWHLYLLYWDSERQLLFVNSSNNETLHDDLAKVVCGDDVELLRGERVFRCLAGINRLILMNLGLSHTISRNVRFTMYVGSDIRQGLSEGNVQNKFKSNLFGRGFEHGDKASVGCSQKGRIWSYLIASDIQEWMGWCQAVGTKLLDDSIVIAEIFKNLIVPRQIMERPDLVPLVIEWPEEMLKRNEATVQVDIDGEVLPFYEVGLELVEHQREGMLRFCVSGETKRAEYRIVFRGNVVDFEPTGLATVSIMAGRRRRSLSEWFQDEPPVIRFDSGAYLCYNELFVPRPPEDRQPFSRDQIEAWTWPGTKLKVESQTVAKLKESVQYHVIHRLLSVTHDPQYDVVFDDDDAYEAADIVALRVAGDRLLVHFFHCKYSSSEKPGARVDDLYAVCGQAQRSVYWKSDVAGLLAHLRQREVSRIDRHNVSRFERGDLIKLDEIARQVHFLTPEFVIFVVQPGLSKAAAETSQLELLAATELYLQETYNIPLGVIASV